MLLTDEERERCRFQAGMSSGYRTTYSDWAIDNLCDEVAKAQHEKNITFLSEDCTNPEHSIAGSFGSHARLFCADCLTEFGLGKLLDV